jgi:hypothetical protein
MLSSDECLTFIKADYGQIRNKPRRLYSVWRCIRRYITSTPVGLSKIGALSCIRTISLSVIPGFSTHQPLTWQPPGICKFSLSSWSDSFKSTQTVNMSCHTCLGMLQEAN